MTPMEDLNFGLCNIDLDIVLSAILFDFAYAFLNFRSFLQQGGWRVYTQQWQRRGKKEVEVQLFEDSEQDGIALYYETYHLHASQIDEI